MSSSTSPSKRVRVGLNAGLRTRLAATGAPAMAKVAAAAIATIAVATVGAGDASAAIRSAAPTQSASGAQGSLAAALTTAPAPPTQVGCYTLAGGQWASTPCATAAYVQQHLPHPELLAGVGGETTPTAAPPFDLGTVSAQVLSGGSDTDSSAGAGYYSLQDNVMFTGSNGHQDGVQFTDQSGGGFDNLCVWQVDVKTQTYTPLCLPMPVSARVVTVEGWAETGILADIMQTTLGPIGVVVMPDLYGLGSAGRWNNNSGSVLGYGGGSHASFSSTEERIGVVASTCMNKAGFVAFGGSVQCDRSQQLKPLAYTGYSPGPLTYGIGTVETNNLVPVIGSPPLVLPGISYPNLYTAKISYVASTTGKCFTGTPPSCN